MNDVPFMMDELLPATHGFFGRRGGVSTGLYDSLNCGAGSDDKAENIQENKKRVLQAMGGSDDSTLVTLHQIHSADCVDVQGSWENGKVPEADAMVTDRSNCALGILTADCGPVLFYGEKDDGRPVVGAAHAGWGGALRGVLENTVSKMKEKGARPESLRAVIGPCIGPDSYEVSEDFTAPFLQQSYDNRRFFKAAARDGHVMFDLPSYIESRLRYAGMEKVKNLAVDTYTAEDRFFSYRRTTHRNEPDYGRQISVIMIP